jgi:hypothetical protein
MAENTVQSGESGRKNNNRLIVVIGCLVIVALVGVIVALVMNLNRPAPEPVVIREEEPSERRAVVVQEENVQEVLEQLEEQDITPQGYYTASMNTTWRFPDGASPSSNAYVGNMAGNTNDVYFDVAVRETGEVIYASPILPVGTELNNFQLDKDLDAGTYRCVCTYHLVDENQKTLSTVNMGVTVIVEN